MATIKIKIPGDTDRTFAVETSGSVDRVLEDVERLLRGGEKYLREPSEARKAANERITRARRHLKRLEKDESSRDALRIANEMRRSWIRHDV